MENYSRAGVLATHAAYCSYRAQIPEIFATLKALLPKQMDWPTESVGNNWDQETNAKMRRVPAPFAAIGDTDRADWSSMIHYRVLIFGSILRGGTRGLYLAILLVQFLFEFLCYFEHGPDVVSSFSALRFDLNDFEFGATTLHGPSYQMRAVHYHNCVNNNKTHICFSLVVSSVSMNGQWVLNI